MGERKDKIPGGKMRIRTYRAWDTEKKKYITEMFCVTQWNTGWPASPNRLRSKQDLDNLMNELRKIKLPEFNWELFDASCCDFHCIDAAAFATLLIEEYTGKNDSTKWEELTEDEKKEWIARRETAESWQGKEIFEGDIVEYTEFVGKEKALAVVKWSDDGAIGWSLQSKDSSKFLISTEEYKLVGNCHMNSHLLEENRG